MNEYLAANILLPIGLGLFGFIEPCSIGSTLVFIKVMEGKTTAVKLWQVSSLFAGLRHSRLPSVDFKTGLVARASPENL
jgi:hypothetical protein